MDEKKKEIKKKSASGIWTWIFWLLFASVVIVVVIGAFGNSIWYAPQMMSTEATPEGAIRGGMTAPIDKDDDMVKTEWAHMGE